MNELCTECKKELTKTGKNPNELNFLDIIVPKLKKNMSQKFRFHYVHTEFLINGNLRSNGK